MKPPKKLTHWWKGVEVEEWEGLHPSSRESQRLFVILGGRRGELYLKKMLIYDESLIGCHGFHLPQTWISMCFIPLPFFFVSSINVSSFLHDPTQQQELLDIRSREISDPWTWRFFFSAPGRRRLIHGMIEINLKIYVFLKFNWIASDDYQMNWT